MAQNFVLNMFNKMASVPGGKKLFSLGVSQKAPYFSTVSPLVQTIRPNYAEVLIKKRRGVQNHIGTVHVIAICNGLEMAMGMVAEGSIPENMRWIPKGMEVEYTAKAGSDITCIAECDPEDWHNGPDLPMRVTALDDNGTVVVKGVIKLWVTEKK